MTASADKVVVWSLASGSSLPPGLSLSSSGKISGTPTRAGEYSFTVNARASTEGLTVSRKLTLTITPAFSILTDAALPRGKVNQWYSVTLSSDAEAVYKVRWEILDGTLPDGLTLNPSTGAISGTPLYDGEYTFTIQATAGDYVLAKRFTLIVASALEILNYFQLTSGKVGRYYYCEFATDSAYSVQWTLASGDIPGGLTFSDGFLYGTPTTEGTYTFTIRAESGGLTTSKTFTLEIAAALSITTPSVLPSVKAGAYYSYVLSCDADNPNEVLWSLSSTVTYSDDVSSRTSYRNMPSGIYIDENTGTIYGTPSIEGVYIFTIRAVLDDVSATKTFTLTVRPTLSITTERALPHAVTNEIYSVTLLTDAEDDEVVTWSIISGDLPQRLTLDTQTGTISGYPLKEGRYTFTIQAFSNGLKTQKEFELIAGEMMNILTSQVVSILKAGESFSLAFETDKDDKSGEVWSIIDGILPPGLELDSASGIISGSPVRAGKYTFTVRCVSGYSVAQKAFTLTVDFAITSDAVLPSGTAGEYYSYRFTADGVSAGAVLWSASRDVLPTGLTLNTEGLLSGTTNEAGSYTFTVYAFVSNDVSAKKIVRFTIETFAAVPILNGTLPDGQVSKDYYTELSSSVEGVSWSVVSGDLPPGLSLGQSPGVITGVPTKAGTFSFIVRAQVSGRESTRQFTITIAPAPEKETYASGGGGGCNNFSGTGIVMSFAAVMLLRKKRRD